jgi:hypothetical protein
MFPSFPKGKCHSIRNVEVVKAHLMSQLYLNHLQSHDIDFPKSNIVLRKNDILLQTI